MKKVLLILTAMILVFSVVSLAAHLVILEINDSHGHAWVYSPYGNPDIGGFAAIATVVNQARQEAEANGWDFLFLHAGDVNTGIPESDLLNAKPDITALNMMGLDAMTIGNHEFDKPWSVLMQQMSWANFPFLCANIVYKGTNETVGSPYVIKSFPDLKVAILGLTTMTTEFTGNPENTKYYKFLSPVTVAKQYVPILHTMVGKDGVVLALTHLGINGVGGDGAEVWNTPQTIAELLKVNKPNDPLGGSVTLAESVPGIAAIMDGHSHTVVESPLDIDGELIIQAGSFTQYVARLDLDIENGTVTSYTYKLIPINLKVATKDASGNTVYNYVGKEIKPDPAVADMLAGYKKMGSAELDLALGTSKVNFDNTNEITRQKDTPLGHLVTDAIAWKFGTQIVMTNGGGYRAGIGPGTITYRDILTVLPFGNVVVTMKLKGSELLKAIQWGAVYHPEDTGARLNPYGLSYTVNGTEVSNILVGGKPLDPNAYYTVATNDYMAAGGDNYTMLKNGEDIVNTGYVLADVVKEYVQHISPINDFPFTPRWTETK